MYLYTDMTDSAWIEGKQGVGSSSFKKIFTGTSSNYLLTNKKHLNILQVRIT